MDRNRHIQTKTDRKGQRTETDRQTETDRKGHGGVWKRTFETLYAGGLVMRLQEVWSLIEQKQNKNPPKPQQQFFLGNLRKNLFD